MSLKELIDNHKYISFDIFDTLIKRYVNKPVDIFNLVEIIYKDRYNDDISGFKYKRIYCEKFARQISNYEDITLDEIYKQLNKYYKNDILIKIKNIEVECELNICKKNDDIVKWFNYAKDKNKIVVIASDIYLDKEIIEKILNKNGIFGYEKIFISSEIRKTKYIGSMYKVILDEFGCNPNEMLHIGDNIIADIKRPTSYGVDTYYVKGSNEGKIKRKIYNRINRDITNEKVIDNIINNFIKDNCKKFNKNVSENYVLGYKYFGLLIYGFLQWIDSSCEKDKIERLYFFSRDGYILNKAYNEFFKAKYKVEYSYLYVSRRTLIVPSIEEGTTLEKLIKMININRKDTIESFFRKLGLNIKDYKEVIKECGLNEKELFDYNNRKEKVEKLFEALQEDILKNSYNKRIKLIEYLKQEKFFKYKNVGIVDIGWRGSLQYSLQKVLNATKSQIKISGFYLGLSNKSKPFIQKGLNAKGYLFSSSDDKLENSFMACLGLIESFFTAPYGSTIDYKIDNNKVSCVLDSYEYGENDVVILNEIQKGALDFIKHFSVFNENIHIPISYLQASKRIINALTNPTYKSAVKLGNIKFSDNGINYIAKPREKCFYIINPKVLKNDFLNSTWKIGFMKRLFRINLPYIKIYSFMKKLTM